MRNIVTAMLGVIAACSISWAQMADTVYTNGKIYTVSGDQPWAEAVAIKDGKFVKVGTSDDVKSLVDAETIVVDLNGKFVMPGFHDTHVHIEQAYIPL